MSSPVFLTKISTWDLPRATGRLMARGSWAGASPLSDPAPRAWPLRWASPPIRCHVGHSGAGAAERRQAPPDGDILRQERIGLIPGAPPVCTTLLCQWGADLPNSGDHRLAAVSLPTLAVAAVCQLKLPSALIPHPESTRADSLEGHVNSCSPPRGLRPARCETPADRRAAFRMPSALPGSRPRRFGSRPLPRGQKP